jgi:hypothetical protein
MIELLEAQATRSAGIAAPRTDECRVRVPRVKHVQVEGSRSGRGQDGSKRVTYPASVKKHMAY